MVPVQVDACLVLGPRLALVQHFFNDVLITWHPIHRKDVEPAEHEHTHGGPHRFTPVEPQTHHHAACHEETERLSPAVLFHSRSLAMTTDKCFWVHKMLHRPPRATVLSRAVCIRCLGVSLFHALRLPPPSLPPPSITRFWPRCLLRATNKFTCFPCRI